MDCLGLFMTFVIVNCFTSFVELEISVAHVRYLRHERFAWWLTLLPIVECAHVFKYIKSMCLKGMECMYVCMPVCMQVCIHVCTHVRMYACIYTCVYMHISMYVCVCALMSACIYICLYVYLYVCMHMLPFTCMHGWMNV